jgi:2-polyprenyl-3-methyl-5-hydroxy-6-metoxy-1,4-benzoquinol methylase
MDKSIKFWDKIANNYDQEEKKDEMTYIRIVEKIRKYFKSSDVVMDFGCGTGLISNKIAGTVKETHAIDTSSKMIGIAKDKAEDLKIENIIYAQSTIFDPRYKVGSFDAVLALYILHILDDAEKVIQRIKDLLKPGGLVISVTPCLGETRFQNYILSVISKLGLIPMSRPFTISELEKTIIDGNFKIVEAECLHRKGHQYFIVAQKNNETI